MSRFESGSPARFVCGKTVHVIMGLRRLMIRVGGVRTRLRLRTPRHERQARTDDPRGRVGAAFGTAVYFFLRRRLSPIPAGKLKEMSTYPDPAWHGDVYPSEEEIDPAGIDGPVGTYDSRPGPQPSSTPVSPPIAGPAGRITTNANSIVSRRKDGSIEVVTDLDGDGIADMVQLDLDGDGVPELTYLDTDRDGQLDTVVRTPNH